ncbi:RidA family protein [Ktedonosporobacter rubrisoli]|uniref:RidA family protein n=1 Tax=Ktedonosporobacter rubrisoli TaxID=2509675 RepID=A0A4P6JWV9_KTERU|nr:RidA family protein [Ktedonosporobacter rubrisoli]QBD79965.1 RidA family protein [Ktedonosporobacter rubrisoli]
MEHKEIKTPHAPAAIGPYNQAIRYGQFIYTSGQIPLDPVSGEIVGEDVQAQTHRVLQNLQAVLSAAGSSLNHVVKTTVFLASMSDFQAMNAVYASYFKDGVTPARTTVAVAELPRKALVEIECVALAED